MQHRFFFGGRFNEATRIGFFITVLLEMQVGCMQAKMRYERQLISDTNE